MSIYTVSTVSKIMHGIGLPISLDNVKCQVTSSVHESPLLEAVLLFLVKQVGFGAAQIYYLWTTVSVFLHNGAFLAVVSIGHALASADDAATLIGAIVALVTYAHQRTRSHI